MKQLLFFLFAITLFPLLNMAQRNERQGSAEQLEALVAQWSSLRLELAGENNRWQTEKPAILNETGLVRAENEYLETMVNEMSRDLDVLLEHSSELTERRDELRAVLKEMGKILEEAEENLSEWQQRIPPALLEDFDPLFIQTSMPVEERRKRTVAERAQTVVALYSQIETIQSRARLVSEMIDTPDGRIEMRVLYLGLTRGFALSGDSAKAYVGVFTDEGLQWQARPGLADSIARAITVYEKRRAPELISLPLKQETPGGDP